jgi:hypothetical protein
MTRELLREVTMGVESANRESIDQAADLTSVDELFARLGHPPLTFEEWAAKAPDVFESEEEVGELLEFTHVERQRFVG